MDPITRYRDMVDRGIEEWIASLPATSLYEPMIYLMRLPAKRIRPIATLMSCELFGSDPIVALRPAIGIELFHNFTLMHDDIMDQAPLRRGHATVHERWNTNTAILSGDAMLVKAYQSIGSDPEVLRIFNSHALAVCEGQQSDMDFEQRSDVSTAEYMEMIRRKTALLLACAMRIGALIAGADQRNSEAIGRFGEHLGIAFQLRDDLLDAFGDPAKLGKQQGGDLRAGKKTLLLIKGLEIEKQNGTSILRDQLSIDPDRRDVGSMLEVLERLGIRVIVEAEVERHERSALDALAAIDVPSDRKRPLQQLAASLMSRLH